MFALKELKSHVNPMHVLFLKKNSKILTHYGWCAFISVEGTIFYIDFKSLGPSHAFITEVSL